MLGVSGVPLFSIQRSVVEDVMDSPDGIAGKTHVDFTYCTRFFGPRGPIRPSYGRCLCGHRQLQL